MSMPPSGQWGPGVPPPYPQQPPPPGYYPPQQGWGPPPPQKSNNTLKWLLGGIAVLLVIAITVGITVLVTRDGSGGDGPTESPDAPSDVASADDTGPIEIITLEPTCEAWVPSSNGLSQVEGNGWGDRDPSIPGSQWTSEQRMQHEAVAKAMQQVADQAVKFASDTPHRSIRQLYEQFIAYARAYADAVPGYTPRDNELALAVVAASISLDSVCDSIKYGSAIARASSVPPAPAPSAPLAPIDPADPQLVLTEPASECAAIVEGSDRLIADLAGWSRFDAGIAEDRWTPEQRAEAVVAKRALTKFADNLESVGEDASSSTFQDLAYFAAVYSRAYVSALDSYRSADSFLFGAGTRANNVLLSACEAIEG